MLKSVQNFKLKKKKINVVNLFKIRKVKIGNIRLHK